MLTPYSRSQFVEKVLTDASGRQFRVVFLVAVVNGELKGRIISARPVAQNILALAGAVTDAGFCLPCANTAREVETPFFSYTAPVVSKYFDLELFLSTQPTRAPAHM